MSYRTANFIIAPVLCYLIVLLPAWILSLILRQPFTIRWYEGSLLVSLLLLRIVFKGWNRKEWPSPDLNFMDQAKSAVDAVNREYQVSKRADSSDE
ncbi:MAG: hypothetical protein JST40_06855 [Armatimonadetes bacterium]|nr:hypothetical protein [Armatimonadota bacterium]